VLYVEKTYLGRLVVGSRNTGCILRNGVYLIQR
jgi:hypothetical protein